MIRYLLPGSERWPAAVAVGAEIELLAGVQQHRAGDRRLRHRGFVEVDELAHLGARQAALEGVVGALDLGDELRHIVVLRDARGGDSPRPRRRTG
jgi:hypothetical protein